MWQILGAATDAIHALLMAVWIVGLPFLFVRRWPRLARAEGIYALTFVVASQVSHLVLGECFLTTVSRWCWERTSAHALRTDPNEWFTVRASNLVFHMAPSHRFITQISEALIVVTAVGVLISLRHVGAAAMQRLLPAQKRSR